MKPTALALILATVAALGCAGRQKTSELPDDVRAFGEGLRWARPDAAAAHIPPRERADFVTEREEVAEDLRIGDWEIERIEWRTPGRRAVVRVQYTWHLDSRGLVHKTWTEQRWELHGKIWLMTGEVRRRGEPMPGVPEPRQKTTDDAAAAAHGAAPAVGDVAAAATPRP